MNTIEGAYFYYSFFIPLIGYWVSVAVRNSYTNSWYATNWINIANLIRWISSAVMFLVPVIVYPFYWFNSDISSFVLAWYMVNILADGMAAFYLIYFFMDLIIAFMAGRDSREICVN